MKLEKILKILYFFSLCDVKKCDDYEKREGGREWSIRKNLG